MKQNKTNSRNSKFGSNGKKNSYNRKQGKGKQSSSKYSQENKDAMAEYKSNDINWWNKSATFSDATRIPFNRLTGATLPLSSFNPGFDVFPTSDNVISLPSFARINYSPVLGIAKDSLSPVNRAMTSLYSAIYSKTTGAMQFQQADMALITLALSSIVTNIGHVKRALAASLLWTGENLAFPYVAFQAMGLDYDEIKGHQDEIRRTLNAYIQNLNTMRLPGYFDIFKRHYQLPTNIYADEDSIKAQMYVFVPQGYYIYMDEPDAVSDAAHLKYIKYSYDENGIISINELLGVIKDQLESIRHSSSFALVSGSMQRAFPDAELLSISLVEGNEILVPVADRNMLWQINNLITIGEPDKDTMHVTQDPVEDILQFQPYMSGVSPTVQVEAYGINRETFLINSNTGDTDSEFIMEATRLMPVGEFDSELADDEGKPALVIEECGTELVHSVRFHNQRVLSNGTIDINWYDYYTTMRTANVTAMLDRLAAASQFRSHPIGYFIGTDGKMALPFGDLNVWTTVDSESLKFLHFTALQSVYIVNVIPTTLQ